MTDHFTVLAYGDDLRPFFAVETTDRAEAIARASSLFRLDATRCVIVEDADHNRIHARFTGPSLPA